MKSFFLLTISAHSQRLLHKSVKTRLINQLNPLIPNQFIYIKQSSNTRPDHKRVDKACSSRDRLSSSTLRHRAKGVNGCATKLDLSAGLPHT